jgi:hypothetical protein
MAAIQGPDGSLRRLEEVMPLRFGRNACSGDLLLHNSGCFFGNGVLVPEETSYITERSFGNRLRGKFPERALTMAVNIVGVNQKRLFLLHRTLGGVQPVTAHLNWLRFAAQVVGGLSPGCGSAKDTKGDRVDFIGDLRWRNSLGWGPGAFAQESAQATSYLVTASALPKA